MRIERYLRNMTLWHMLVGVLALATGVTYGLFQVLARAGIYKYGIFTYDTKLYYQGLTLHGVLNAIVFTTFFIVGFLYIVTEVSLKRKLNRWLVHLSFWTMLLGTLLASWAIFTNKATVLYTFYPPLQAHPAFYVGATLIIVGSWIAVLNTTLAFLAWRRENPGKLTPPPMVAVLTTYIVWFLATIGVAIEVLVFLIPWSLGIVKVVNPELARTLFWWFGHPLVYFWLLPAYLAWYFMLPRIAGGKLYSEPMARVVFIMFILFSLPVGTHHQFSDPGISSTWKAIQAFLTFMVAVPSLLTAFNLAASLEYAGRVRGGEGLFGWIRTLPWKDYRFAGMVGPMIVFIFGGISGIVNASYSVNQVVHNTSWIPGHFHMTVGTAAAMTFLTLSYILMEKLFGKRPWSKTWATIHAYLWVVGVLIFAWGMMQLGRAGIPRRTHLGLSPYMNLEEKVLMGIAAVGGTLMFTAVLIYFVNFLMTLFKRPDVPDTEEVDLEFTEAYHPEREDLPRSLDNFKLWIAVAVLLLIITYGPIFYDVLKATYFVPNAFSPFNPLNLIK
ncbi:MAG: cytochrome C oxidase subunit I [Thermotogae bacterium]|nr:cytochrome C oxidase subunit I [Thermotogota bacterium]